MDMDKFIWDVDNLIGSNCNSQEEKWRQDLKYLAHTHHHFSSFANEFDYSSDLKFNGVRTYLKMLITYFDRVLKILRESKRKPKNKGHKEELEVLRGQCFNFISMGDSIKRIYKNWSKLDANNNNNDNNNNSNNEFITEAEDSFIRAQKEQSGQKLADFFNIKFGFPWLAKRMLLIARLTITSLYFVSTPIKESIFGVFSTSKVSKFYTHLITKETIGALHKTIHGYLEGSIFDLFIWTSNQWNRDLKVSYPTLFHRQSDWVIDEAQRSIERYTANSKLIKVNGKSIKCVLIKPRNFTSGNIIFHIHGGGFVVTTAKTYIPFFRPIVQETGAAVLALEYSLSPQAKYPVALQECLDVYLNLVSSRPFTGFKPKKIILMGDSAGGYSILAISIAIAQIRSSQATLQDEQLTPLPHAINAIYPVASCCIGHLYPSRALIDLCLFPKSVAHFAGAYAGSVDEDEFFAQKGFHWHEDESTLKMVSSKINSRIDDPFFHLPSYKHFHLLKSIPLYIQVSEFDLFLDDAITLAKCWKGIVKLDIIPDVIHGWTMIEFLADKSFKGCKIIRNNLKDALKREADENVNKE